MPISKNIERNKNPFNILLTRSKKVQNDNSLSSTQTEFLSYILNNTKTVADDIGKTWRKSTLAEYPDWTEIIKYYQKKTE